MKYRIITTLKKGILDNAGKATTRALSTLGFTDVEDVRIGKTFELECDSSDIESVAQSMTNAVMEEYIIEEI
jgi:phosphoribosylformylglycinamidine synthase|tara:strand:+ start:39 stop:254 length:216 start_codon:yes stop_codon:yes gene_type:complete